MVLTKPSCAADRVFGRSPAGAADFSSNFPLGKPRRKMVLFQRLLDKHQRAALPSVFF